jgi:hypothetical protein
MVIDNVDELNDQISKFLKFEKDLKDYLIGYFKNKSISLEDRWATFERIGNIFPIHPWYISLKELDNNDLEWYADFGYDRYRTVEFLEVVQTIEENDYMDVDLNRLKEEILESGYFGFTHDW